MPDKTNPALLITDAIPQHHPLWEILTLDLYARHSFWDETMAATSFVTPNVTPGNDLVIGTDGDDTLDGGVGADTMIGGRGYDTYIVDNLGDVVIENANEGYDTVNASVNYTLGNYVEDLNLFGSATKGIGNDLDNWITGNVSLSNSLDGGAGDDHLIGNMYADTLIGGDGNDYLYGGAGADRMIGGRGGDLYFVDNVRDVVIETKADYGDDAVVSSINYKLGDYIENLSLVGSATIGTGNSLGNRIFGNYDYSSILDGGAGNDTLVGAGHNDTLIGGKGVDDMLGGAGDDVYYVDEAYDGATEDAGGGYDTVYASVSYTLLSDFVEDLVLTGAALNGTGNASANKITGNASNNVLSGADGDDTLIGGSGTDVLTGGGGADRFEFSRQNTGRDTITDFVKGEDLIVLKGFGLGTLQDGYNLMVDAGPAGHYATLLYNTNTGLLSFDADGTGAEAARAIAVISTKPVLTSSDFILA